MRPDTFDVTDDPETWRAVYEAACERDADIELTEETLAILRSFGPPQPAPLGPSLFTVAGLPVGVVRLRPQEARPR